MADADYYREQSEFCAGMADIVRNPEDKSRWLQLVREWRDLAEQVSNAHHVEKPADSRCSHARQ
jgi:hypothetical protein